MAWLFSRAWPKSAVRSSGLEPHGRAHQPRCEAHGPKPFRRLLLHGANDRRIDQAFVAAPGNAPQKARRRRRSLIAGRWSVLWVKLKGSKSLRAGAQQGRDRDGWGAPGAAPPMAGEEGPARGRWPDEARSGGSGRVRRLRRSSQASKGPFFPRGAPPPGWQGHPRAPPCPAPRRRQDRYVPTGT